MGDAEARDEVVASAGLVWLKALGKWVLIVMVLLLAGFLLIAFLLVGSTVPTTHD